jgi:CII-binding regulator of phage lambda lysogenization HflD
MINECGSGFDITAGLRNKIEHLQTMVEDLRLENEELIKENEIYKQTISKIKDMEIKQKVADFILNS